MAFWAVPNQTMTVDGENGFELYGDFQCDAASDLADNLDGVPIARGSIAMDISTGNFYSRATDGTWYAADGSGAASDDSDSVQSLSMSPNLNLSPQLDTGIRPALNLNALPADVPEAEEPEMTDEIAETEPEEEPAEDGEER